MKARAALFLAVGFGFLLFWLCQESGWREPLPDSDTRVVLGFSALLAGQGASLLLWAPGRRSAIVSATAAFASAGVNLLEDGLGLEWAFFAFIASSLTLLIGQLVLAARSGPRRAIVPALSALALGIFPVAGGPLMALAWTTAAGLSAGQLPRSPGAKKS